MSSKQKIRSPPPPQAMPQQQAQVQPQYAQTSPPYMPPPPQRSTSNVLLIVIVVVIIILVVVPVILAAIMYFMVSGMIGGGGSEPTVSLTQADIGTTTATVDIAGVDPAGKALSEFKAILLYNSTSSGGTLSPLTDGGSDGSLTFTDMDSGGTLSGGDRFTIDINANTDYELILYFATEKIVSRSFSIL